MQLQELEGNNEESLKNVSPNSLRPRQGSNWVHPKHKSDVLTMTAHSSPQRILINTYIQHKGHRGSTVVKVLCYKSEGRWFDPESAFSSGAVRTCLVECSERSSE